MTRSKSNKKAYQSLGEVDRQIDSAIIQTNQRLKAVESKLTIIRRKQRLFLRGTLPCKPGESTPSGTKRYEISVASPTLDGIKVAEAKALEITHLLKLGNFTWEPFGAKVKPKIRIMAEVKADFEKDYWRDKAKTRKTLNTWNTHYRAIFKKIPDSDYFTEKNTQQWIETTLPNTETRRQLNWVIQTLAKFEGLQIKSYSCKVTPKPRIIPTDLEIELAFAAMPGNIAWTFGMMATYGFRTQEVFIGIEEHLDFFTSPENKFHKFQVDSDTKTGERLVYPIHPEWVERFDLLNPKRFPSNAKKYISKVNYFNRLIKKYGFNYGAYALRHRYAIRAHELDIPINDAARWMGHSVQEHLKTYHKYLGDSTSEKIFESLLIRNQEASELDRLRLENQFLRERVAELEALL